MSCFICSKKHQAVIGLILAFNESDNPLIDTIISYTKAASSLNAKSVSARYNEKNRAYRFNGVSKVAFDIFESLSDAQKAVLIDSFLYQCDNAPNFESDSIVLKLKKIRNELKFYQDDYDAACGRFWGLV